MTLDVEQVRQATEVLRRLLAAVEAGEIDAGPGEVRRLQAAVESLDLILRT